MNNHFKYITMASLAVLSGCMVGPDYEKPSADFALEDLTKETFHRDNGLWKTAKPLEDMPKGNWWTIFKDSQLNMLLELCKENNPTLAAGFYKVEQLRQAARLDEAELFPLANGDISYLRSEGSKNVYYPTDPYNNWLTGLGMTWDLDLFGRIRSILESDIADAQAAASAYNSLILSMQTNVSKTYFTILLYYSELDLLQQTLDVRIEQTKLVKNRVSLEFASELDLQRAIAQEEEARLQYASIKTSLTTSLNNLAILVGLTPSQLKIQEKKLPDVLPILPKAVPSELLERRPDIAQAERKVYAANARIGAAQAGFFPTVSITATTSLEASSIDTLLKSSSFAWGVSPQVYIPIFQAGKVYAQKQVALAAHKETLENYKATVLNAIGEVENALSEINNLENQYTKSNDVVNATSKVLELTNVQYDLGYVDYFPLSDASSLLLVSQREHLRIKGLRFIACIDLISALGGGWQAPNPDDQDDILPDMYEGISDKI